MAEAIPVDHLSLTLPEHVPAVAATFAAAVADGEPLTAALGDAVRALGFETFTYFVTTVAAPTRDSRLYTWTNAPMAWVVEYERTGMVEFDPRFLLGQETAAPLVWDRNIVETHPSTARFFEAAARHGICSGIALRLFDPNHGLSGFSFGLSRPMLDDYDRSRISEQLPALMEFAHFLNAHLLVAVANHKLPPVALGAPLSPRERQCLQLVARGLASPAIAAHLGIGERTVHYHVANLIMKLGAANRQEAVARAIAARIIEG